MNTMKYAGFAASALTLAVLGSMGWAQEVDPAVDANGDGVVSFPELVAAYPEMTEEAFAMMDSSGDGVLDSTEITAAIEAGLMVPSEG